MNFTLLHTREHGGTVLGSRTTGFWKLLTNEFHHGHEGRCGIRQTVFLTRRIVLLSPTD